MWRNSTISGILVFLIAVGIGPLVAVATGSPYLLSIFERFLIFAVAASSLNLILGYGGMVNFGHAAYLGIGAYATAVLANSGYSALWIQAPVVVLASTVAAAAMGTVALRTSGIHFIMITLALAQILFYMAQSSSTFGGDDGLIILERSTLWQAYDSFDPWHLYGFIAVSALLLLALIDFIVRSDFGRRLVAARENMQRANALGFDVIATRLTAFMIAGAVCGLAGLLLANQSEIASPGYADWQRSGELLAIVILGGVGTRFGPIYGALAFVSIEHFLASISSHWPILFGPLLILIVLFFHSGLSGLVAGLGRILRNPQAGKLRNPQTEGGA